MESRSRKLVGSSRTSKWGLFLKMGQRDLLKSVQPRLTYHMAPANTTLTF